ncbi:MBOAT family O-acyltransferase [Haloferula sp. A504]|uniref:MBOAT family O-acyltransferase n=1 Tax=Haloferula sp. A504 TaxID=3373601 RepID=UPI0031CA348F|nr:hypothetical protein [Verrucomicrobiaceae bacterium E54]
MNFASYEFWQTLLFCFLGSRLLILGAGKFSPAVGSDLAKLCLLATGLILLATESWLTVGAFVWVVLLGWISLLLQDRPWQPRLKTALWILLLVAQLTPLLYFKYWDFLFNQILGLDLRVPSVLIPMGLSFYTFQTIGFWIDNLRQPAPRPRFIDFLNFAAFFPQIVAGPIEKREALLPQIRETSFRLHRENLDAALPWIVLGLAYKLIVADNIAVESDKFTIDPSNPIHVWFECLAFGIRIYFDFAGYSFIAVGLGLLFGIRLTLNFRSPYFAADFREFWRNWHVTLGAWLRDYIYLPLGGRRVRWWAVNALIVFLVSGIWHGAGWGFLVWGVLHGLGVVVSALVPKPGRLRPLYQILTFTLCTAAWLFFFERDATLLAEKSFAMIQPTAYSVAAFSQAPNLFGGPGNLVTTGFILALAAVAMLLEGLGLRKSPEPYVFLRHPVASVILVFLTVLLAPKVESSFIYFNF